MKEFSSRATEKISVLRKRMNDRGYLFFPALEHRQDPLEFLAGFGQCRLQDNGQPYYIVRAGEVLQPIDGGPLMPHTDDFNVSDLPPRLAALYCVYPGIGGGGETLIADGYEWLNSQAKTIEILKKRRLYKRGGEFVELPFLSISSEDAKILRVSFGHLQYADDERMTRIMANLKDWFFKTALSIRYQRRSLLVWNNWRIIHGRTAYGDLSRELRRYHLN